jgi:hypothetical protein
MTHRHEAISLTGRFVDFLDKGVGVNHLNQVVLGKLIRCGLLRLSFARDQNGKDAC